MVKLEDIKQGQILKGLLPDSNVTVENVKWHGQTAIEVIYRNSQGKLDSEIIYRDKEDSLEMVQSSLPWNFKTDASLFKLISEAYRIKLAYLFDPLLAVHTSKIDPYPHQITAVYEEMLKRQPLRFLLADDPGAGKTIMTGLFIKELIARGDLSRCLIVCPGNLAEQWQDELREKFDLEFEILSTDRINNAKTGNVFHEVNLAIARLDKLSRDEDVQGKLRMSDWDLIVCDEAHKMSASVFGGETKYTKRHKLGKLLSTLTRHFLLLTATPHNGKDEDFQLFMQLIDEDRFEGKYRKGIHLNDVSDLIRRMQKENLLKFDGNKLFPPRFAYTVSYELSEDERNLYDKVTEYVRNEFNRADALGNEKRKGTVGFALTTLQRRLASSPGAIYESLKRRKGRLEKRLKEIELGEIVEIDETVPLLTDEDIEDIEDAPDAELGELEEKIIDEATASRTIAELKIEIDQLKGLESVAAKVKASDKDKKWDELNKLLHDNPEMYDGNGSRRKLIIFTEHRDTLSYLLQKIRSFLGKHEAVVEIHGAMNRKERKRAQELFTNDKDVHILVATDAAGEGINLQRAHLMINYDLPWNPNRIEQRFGRIHRIKQENICHLWNIVAQGTREGDVYKLLLEKLARAREALGGSVFDVIGKAIDGKGLRELLIQAIRYGDKPDVKESLKKKVEEALDEKRFKELIEEKALSHEVMDAAAVFKIKEHMERAEARKLQPHFIASFFLEALKTNGGSVKEREQKRYEITYIPAKIRKSEYTTGTGKVVLERYERICFEKDLISQNEKPIATFVCPGHPLLDSTIEVILGHNKDLLKQGSILIDDNDETKDLRILLFLEHTIQDARLDKTGNRRVVSKQVRFVELNEKENIKNAGYAPYLSYRPPKPEEKAVLEKIIQNDFLKSDFEELCRTYAINHIVPNHLEEVKGRREVYIEKAKRAVHDRLTKEITYWDKRAEELKAQELAGKFNAKLNSGKARQRADQLEQKLKRRMDELEKERNISPLPPVILGGSIIIPKGLINESLGIKTKEDDKPSINKDVVEKLAMEKVIEHQQKLGRYPRDVSSENLGYDIESKGKDGHLFFIEVKGRDATKRTVTITKNEILTSLNKPNQYAFALVLVDENGAKEPKYLYQFIKAEPDFAVTSINYDIKRMLSEAKEWIVEIN